jgi:hypothetical protein
MHHRVSYRRYTDDDDQALVFGIDFGIEVPGPPKGFAPSLHVTDLIGSLLVGLIGTVEKM